MEAAIVMAQQGCVPMLALEEGTLAPKGRAARLIDSPTCIVHAQPSSACCSREREALHDQAGTPSQAGGPYPDLPDPRHGVRQSGPRPQRPAQPFQTARPSHSSPRQPSAALASSDRAQPADVDDREASPRARQASDPPGPRAASVGVSRRLSGPRDGGRPRACPHHRTSPAAPVEDNHRGGHQPARCCRSPASSPLRHCSAPVTSPGRTTRRSSSPSTAAALGR